MPETTMESLKNSLIFPASCYVKENGYLGLVSYDKFANDLFVTTKSDPTGDYAMWFRELLKEKCGDNLEKIRDYLKRHNVTFLFEVIDITNDPHIIEYAENKIVLLDVIENRLDKFKKLSYDKLLEVASEMNLEVKKEAIVLHNFKEFETWYKEIMDENYEYNGKNIEGFVIEDNSDFMTKVKCHYYKFWKTLRGKAGMIRGRNLSYEDVKTGDENMDKFLKWFCENKDTLGDKGIIELRRIFEKTLE